MHGRWGDAWNSNILSPVLVFCLAVTFIYTLVFRLLAGRAIDLELTAGMRRLAWASAATVIAGSWLVNLLRAF